MSKSRITIEKRTARDANEKLPPIHPGDVLADTLREAGTSATSAAIAMGLPPSTLTNHKKPKKRHCADSLAHRPLLRHLT